MQTYKNNIHFNANRGLSNGINICRKAVEGTIGGAGKPVLIEKEDYPNYISTKDAYSIIQSIKCEDPVEKQAVALMKDATDSMNKIAKDGRTAMCLITDTILQETEKSGANPSEVAEEINNLLPFIEEQIDKQTKAIDVDQIEAVARTASNSDRLAKIIASVYQKQGKDCIINHIESSGTLDDYVVLHDGVRFQDTGFLSDSFVHDEQALKDGRPQKKAVYENPAILVTKRKITQDSEIAPLIDTLLSKNKKNLIIFTDDMDSVVATNLVNTHKAHIMNICIVKAPVLWKQFVFEDFAKATGSTILEDATGVTFENLTLEHLGTCGRIEVDKEECVINGTADLTDHINDLKLKGDDDSLRRVWWLTAKTATIRIGATNEGELSNLRLAAQDAVYSCQAALQSGIVAGGGVALNTVAQSIDNPILKSALTEPIKQICRNAKYEIVTESNNPKGTIFLGFDTLSPSGFDAKTKKIVDMFEAGIVDASRVVKNSVRNAIKIATIALVNDKFIEIPKKTLETMQMELLSKQRMPF